MDCVAPFPRLFGDLPKSDDVVNTRSPFEEAYLLFKNGVLQGGGYAFFGEIQLNTLLVSCENRKCCPSIRYNQIRPSLSQASLTIKPVSRKSRVRGKSSEGDERSEILLFLLIQRSCRLLQSKRFVFLISVIAMLVS